MLLATGLGGLAACLKPTDVKHVEVDTAVSPLLPDARISVSSRGKIKNLGYGCRQRVVVGNRRQQVIDIAVSQWRRFGYVVIDRSGRFRNQSQGDLRGLVARRIPALNEAPQHELIQSDEEAGSVNGAIAGYWSTVDPAPAAHGEPSPGSRLWHYNRQIISASSARWSEPWSAAFVSWVMCEAGADETDFPKASSHVEFLIASEDLNKSRLGWYQSLLPKDAGSLNAGDIVCAARGNYSQDFLDGPVQNTMPAHCDIIVDIDPDHGLALAIGGNIRDKVAMSILSLERAGNGFVLAASSGTTVAMPWLRVLRMKAPAPGASIGRSFRVLQFGGQSQ